ncbi:MAG: MarR family transcriptional regulator [Pseudomonadota bacterium]
MPTNDSDLALLLDRFVRRVHISLTEKAQEFDRDRIGPGGAILLLTLADLGQPTMQELARRMARDKSQMTRAVAALEQKGMVGRATSKADGRVSHVVLTPKGHAMVETHRNAVAETIGDILTPIAEVERAALRALLAKVLE